MKGDFSMRKYYYKAAIKCIGGYYGVAMFDFSIHKIKARARIWAKEAEGDSFWEAKRLEIRKYSIADKKFIGKDIYAIKNGRLYYKETSDIEAY